MYLLSSDELKTYDHSACDIKINIVIDFSYLNDMDLYLNQTLRILRVKKTWIKKKMVVNKNMSILMLFDCVQVNTGLGFH